MATRSANASWEGDLATGNGTMHLGTGSWAGPYSAKSRFEEGEGTNPEELIAGAHAGCFSMAFAHELAQAGHAPESVETTAEVHLNPADGGFAINRIDLTARARVPGIDEQEFQRIGEAAKAGCPVSKALGGVPEINLDATLES
jgi:osmotically inducible protein OsmC